jgi:hypothetical protein
MFPLPEAGGRSKRNRHWVDHRQHRRVRLSRWLQEERLRTERLVRWILLVSVLTFIATVVAAWAAVKAL